MKTELMRKLELELYEKQNRIIKLQSEIINEMIYVFMQHTEIQVEELKDIKEKMDHVAAIREECE